MRISSAHRTCRNTSAESERSIGDSTNATTEDVVLSMLEEGPFLASRNVQSFRRRKEKWVSSFEKDYVSALLKRNAGNISHAAKRRESTGSTSGNSCKNMSNFLHGRVRLRSARLRLQTRYRIKSPIQSALPMKGLRPGTDAVPVNTNCPSWHVDANPPLPEQAQPRSVTSIGGDLTRPVGIQTNPAAGSQIDGFAHGSHIRLHPHPDHRPRGQGSRCAIIASIVIGIPAHRNQIGIGVHHIAHPISIGIGRLISTHPVASHVASTQGHRFHVPYRRREYA